MEYTVEIETSAPEQAWLEKAAETAGMTAGEMVQIIAETGYQVFMEQVAGHTVRRATPGKPAPMDFRAAQPPAPIKWPKYGKAAQR